MFHWTNTKRWLTLALVLTMLVSVLCIPASAVATNLAEAKDSLLPVTITQKYGASLGYLQEKENATHDITTKGKNAYLTYQASLQMHPDMADYLVPRQGQLYKADFTVQMRVDFEWLEFVEEGEALTFTFKSSFLKPVQPANAAASDYSFALTDTPTEGGIKYFVYTITAKKSWIENNYTDWSTDSWTQSDGICIPMELIVYADAGCAYGFNEARGQFADKELMYKYWTRDQWMAPITLELATMKVKADKIATVGKNSSKVIEAYGTIHGSFAYVKAIKPEVIGDIKDSYKSDYATYENGEILFGHDSGLGETDQWISNKVTLTLLRDTITPTPTPGSDKIPSDLNITDHFAYVIGYPDGNVKPGGNITRAEVATIFFRMLKDEPRERYWSTTNDYTDVASDDWFNNAISTLSNMGIINGYPDGSFRPNAGITRAEFAKIAVSFFRDYSRQTLGDLFSDISGQWYTNYINLAAELAIVSGYPDGTFRPGNNITRAEAMTIVNNTLRRTPCKEGLLPVEQMITWPDNPDTAWFYEAVQEATNSHEYERASIIDKETWIAPLPVRDWAAFEKEWSNANSAYNPGEVVDGTR